MINEGEVFKRVKAGVLLRCDGKYLMLRRAPDRKYAGQWNCPGGKVAAGESLRIGAWRELHEEAGIDLLHHCVKRERMYDHGVTPGGAPILIYVLELDEMLPMVGINEESDQYGWFTRAEAECLPLCGPLLDAIKAFERSDDQ